jgi:four helix bundle protein
MAKTPIKSYKDLHIWQQSMELVKLTYSLSRDFPKEEMYGLTAQIRRSAVSVPSNIAEGHARDYRKEYLQFLSFAAGSLAELQTQLQIAYELEFITQDAHETVDDLADKTLRMLRNLQMKLKTPASESLDSPLPSFPEEI